MPRHIQPGTFRVILSTGRIVESPSTITTPQGAKRWGREWASNVGVRGHIQVEELRDGAWVLIARAEVRDSVAGRWVTAESPSSGSLVNRASTFRRTIPATDT
jgi:hypothetical protein